MENNKHESKLYSFFCHKECEYFPCHQIKKPDDFNCLFCYCPLYSLGEKCGGNYKFTKSGIKNCEDCSFPHEKNNYDEIIRILGEATAPTL